MKILEKKITITFNVKSLLICALIISIYLSSVYCVSFIYSGCKYHTSVLDFRLDSYIRLYFITIMIFLLNVILGLLSFNLSSGVKNGLSGTLTNLNSKVPIIVAMIMSASIAEFLASSIFMGHDSNVDYVSLLFKSYNYLILLLAGFIFSVVLSFYNVKHNRRNGFLEFLFCLLIAAVNAVFIVNIINYVDSMFAYLPFYNCLLFYKICIALIIILESAISLSEQRSLLSD